MENKSKLVEGIATPALSFYEKDEPIWLHILESGWGKPQLYHVIVEHGDIMRVDNHLLDSPQILEKFGIDVEMSYINKPIVLRRKQVIQIGNDQELGNTIRKQINS
jgi:hypothetical protein